MKSFLSSPVGLFTFSLIMNVAALFGLAVPFGLCWNYGIADALRVTPLSYLQAVAALGSVMVLKMAVIGVKLTAER